MVCRGEFPHLQQALDKFGERGFVILAVNLEKAHDEFVLPILKANAYRFVALKSDWDWAKASYDVDGTPANFLIDAQGRVIFKPVVHDAATRLVLEREVEMLLDR